MIFAGIDVNIVTHEKALSAGVEAMGLWLWGMCQSQIQATNGRLARVAVLTAMGGRRNVVLAKRLVDSGLWIANEDGSWSIWNYEKKNQTREEIQSRRDASRAANTERQRIARERRHALSHSVSLVTSSDSHALSRSDESVTSRDVTGLPLPLQTPLQTPLQNQDTEIGTEPAPAASSPEVGESKASRRKPETPCPESLASDGEVLAWAERWKIPFDHAEFAGFLDLHRQKGSRWRDWSAAWRTWLRNAKKFAGRGAASRGAEITKQAFDPEAPWMKLPEAG